MKKKLEMILLVVLLLLLSSCSIQGETKMPNINLSIEKMNTDIEISAPPELNTNIIGDVIHIALYNYSDKVIVFNQSYGVHIFMMDSNGWEEINNKVDYGFGENYAKGKNY